MIEGVTSITTTTTIKVQSGVLAPATKTLCYVYKPVGKCVAVTDKFVVQNCGAHRGLITDMVEKFEAEGDGT